MKQSELLNEKSVGHLMKMCTNFSSFPDSRMGTHHFRGHRANVTARICIAGFFWISSGDHENAVLERKRKVAEHLVRRKRNSGSGV